jgi:hypothetical protein
METRMNEGNTQRTKSPKVITPATIPLWPDTGKLLGISRGATYLAAARGDIPTVRIGGRILALVGPLHKMLGVIDE